MFKELVQPYIPMKTSESATSHREGTLDDPVIYPYSLTRLGSTRGTGFQTHIRAEGLTRRTGFQTHIQAEGLNPWPSIFHGIRDFTMDVPTEREGGNEWLFYLGEFIIINDKLCTLLWICTKLYDSAQFLSLLSFFDWSICFIFILVSRLTLFICYAFSLFTSWGDRGYKYRERWQFGFTKK